MVLAPHTRLGPYEIQDSLGAGGMGEVYRALDTRLGRSVAIKVLPERFAHDAQASARFHREARTVASLSHPNIVAIHDIGQRDGLTYVVMELLEGQTLGSALRGRALDLRETVEIAAAVADGLAVAHSKGVVHRDIKPENIFLLREGGVKVLDFGLARVGPDLGAGGDETSSPCTQPGVLLGTVAYMSPEQVRGQPAEARSDLFALGCVLYEMISGRKPFRGPTSAETMYAILHEVVPPLGQTGRHGPPELERIVQRCLEKDPQRRFASAVALAVALREVTQSASGTAPAQNAAVAGPSVAVLAFQNMSSERENEYFSDGLAEELINALTKVEGLHVASRTSTFAFKGRNEDVRKIGEQLNVRTILEGSVRKAGNRLRITAQLINVADGFHLWSESFNRELEDVFAIQDEIAHNIVKVLRVILTERERRAIEQVPPVNVQAYDHYLRGRQFVHQFRRRAFEFATQMFARAIAIDPEYARAHAGLADCHSLLFMYWDTNPRNLQMADDASRRALELSPNLAEAHVARGLAVALKKDYVEAERQYEAATALDPTLFEARYFWGRVCLAQGKLEEAARHFEAACQLRPDDYQAASHLASIYTGLHRSDDAQAAARAALEVIQRHLELHPDDARAHYLGAVAWCQQGQMDRALEWADRALAMDPSEPVTLYNVACVYALQGVVDKALDCLHDAVRHGFAHKEWIEHDSDLNSLHTHHRFAELLAKL